MILEQFADRLTLDFRLKLAKSLRIKGFKGARGHVVSQDTYEILPSLLTPSTLAAVNKALLVPCHCYGNTYGCKFLPQVIALFNTSTPSDFRLRLPDQMRTWILSCLHPKGCLDVFNYLEDRAVLPTQQVSMRQAKINLVVPVDMVKYHQLLIARFCDFQVKFNMKLLPEAHKQTLLPAFRIFERVYGWKFQRKLKKHAAKLAELAVHHKGIPRAFLYYLEDKLLALSLLPPLPSITTLKRYKGLILYSKRRGVLAFLYLRSKLAPYKRLSKGLARYLSGFF